MPVPRSSHPVPIRRLSVILIAAGSVGGCGGDRDAEAWYRYRQTEDRPAIVMQTDGRRPPVLPPAPAAEPEVLTTARATVEEGRLALADALVIAIAGNRDYRIALSEVVISDLSRTRARAEVHAPSLEADYTFIRNEDDTAGSRAELATSAFGFELTPFAEVDYTEDALVAPAPGDRYQSRIGIEVSRRLLAFNEHRRLEFPIVEADLQHRITANDQRVTYRDLILDVTREFFAIQRTAASLEVRRQRVEDARQFLESVRESIRFGFTAPAEEPNALIELARAESELVSEQARLRTATERLLSRLDLPLDAEFELVPEDVTGIEVPEHDLEADILLVRNSHERVANQLLRIELQEERIAFARDDVRPDLTLSVDAARVMVGDGPYDDTVSGETEFSVRLGLSMPLDGWRDARADLTQERERLHQARIRLRSVRTELEAELRQAHRRIEELRRVLELAIARLEAEQARLEVTLTQYENNEISNLEVTRAQEDVVTAEISLLNARIDLVLADAAYRALLPVIGFAEEEP